LVALAGTGMLVAGLNAPARASSQTDAVEVRLLQLINQGRGSAGKGAEVMHSGLRLAAQQHSADMSARNTMDHSGYPARVNNANPDPAEANGPPDDGFNGSSCENVAWWQPGSAVTTDQVAQEFYNLWYNSAEHHNCMFDVWNYGLNVAGVGIYYANGKWWATFDSAYDSTPPSGTTPPPSSSPPPPSSNPPPPSTSPTWNRVQESSSAVTVSGAWRTVSSTHASGGSYLRSNATGSSATFNFTGTGVRWIGIGSTTGGIANVKLDGVSAGTVDQYAPSTTFGKVMFQRTGLSDTTHTLQITVSGTKDSRATDTRSFVDAFDYFG
jgi:uncharacterized protein YkwD